MGIIQKPTELRGVFDLNYHSHVLRFILKDNKRLKTTETN